MNDPIFVTSRLSLEHRSALEQLLFFNANQHRVRLGIQQSIETYGVPEIGVDFDSLRVRVGDIEGVQTLFATSKSGRLRGVAVFVRPLCDRFVVLHLGIAAPLNASCDVDRLVLLRLMHEIRGAAKRTRGVARIEWVYKERHAMRVSS